MERVWYVAYGSNLSLTRFRCYLAGGRPAGGMRDYVGCRDKRDPERIVSVDVPGGLVFAGESKTWSGGMAFYVFESESTNQDGEHVSVGTWTNIVRGVS